MLLIPAGMYFFARRHLDETAARIALVMGTFWHDLVGFGPTSSADSATVVPGYSVERTFGPIRLRARRAPTPPPNTGIRFVDGNAEER